MHAMVLCVLCILSCLSARAVWSLCKFLAQTSRRAPRRAPRSNGDMEGARLERARGAIDVRRATGNEKPGRLAKRLDAPLELTDRSEPRRHLRPGSGSFDKAIAHGRSAKARDTKECAPATAPGQSTVSSETVPAQAGSHRRSLRRSGPTRRSHTTGRQVPLCLQGRVGCLCPEAPPFLWRLAGLRNHS